MGNTGGRGRRLREPTTVRGTTLERFQSISDVDHENTKLCAYDSYSTDLTEDLMYVL